MNGDISDARGGRRIAMVCVTIEHTPQQTWRRDDGETRGDQKSKSLEKKEKRKLCLSKKRRTTSKDCRQGVIRQQTNNKRYYQTNDYEQS